MKNKEKYAECVLTFACDESGFGVYEKTGEMERCMEMHCTECLFYGKKETCHTSRRKWLESEYIEKPVISKRDRAFLECIGEGIKYIARDMDGFLFIYCIKPHKLIDCWERGEIETNKSLEFFKLNLPMVKWSDKEPWLIEDLKNLEVVEQYEHEELKRNL